MRTLKFFIIPVLYLVLGTFITIELLKIILNGSSVSYLMLLIPLTMFTVLLTVIGIVNAWVQYRMLRDDITVRRYDIREMLWLYLRCWLVLVCGITLSVVFYWLHDLLPEVIQDLTESLYNLFYVICGFLTISSLLSIILRENLNEIKLQNAENENQLLKAQLNPHFLYNTLNNIDALVWLDQERASKAVTSLSDLMRYLTYSSKQEKIAIKEDVLHLNQLIELERLRVNNPEAISFDVEIDDDAARIAPLLMIPLVENCFKHCGNINETGAVKISIKLKDGELNFLTDNNLPEEEETKSPNEGKMSESNHEENAKEIARTNKKKKGGIGLVVLRRRLSLLYPNRFSLIAETKSALHAESKSSVFSETKSPSLAESKDRRYQTVLRIKL